MKLYELSWGIHPRRVIVYLAEKGIVLDRVSIDVLSGENRKPDFLSINPEGTLPVLELDNGSRICESLAIIEYLEEVSPDPDFIGSLALTRARTREMAQIIAEAYVFFNRFTAHASPAFQTRFEQNAEIAQFMKQQYVEHLAKVDRRLDGQAYVCGNDMTYADCMLFASAQFAHLLYKSPIPKEFENLTRFYRDFSSRSSAAVPDYPEMLLQIAPIQDQAAA